MIVIANDIFATGMRLAGIKKSFSAKDEKQVIDAIKNAVKDEFIMATESIISIYPKLAERENIIIFPDTLKDFSEIDDLKQVIKEAIGSDIEI